MRYFILLFLAFVLQKAYSQDIICTIEVELDGENTTIDSIIIDNLSNNSTLKLHNFEFEEGYKINLTKGTFWEENSNPDTGNPSMSAQNSISLIKNLPGAVSFSNNGFKAEKASIELYSITGSKIYNESFSWYPNQKVGLTINQSGLYIVVVKTANFQQSYKAMGNPQNSDEESLLEIDNHSSLKSIQTGLEDFSCNIGDSLRIMVYKANYYANPVLVAISGDEVFLFELEQLIRSFIDPRDNYEYSVIEIGEQIWMADNLAWLPEVYPSSSKSYGSSRFYVYGYEGTDVIAAKNNENYITYGTLYNWQAALEACPSGWHLPSDNEWKKLELVLGLDGFNNTEVDKIGWRGSTEGTLLKSENGWTQGENGVDLYGFAAIPGGNYDGTSNFINIGDEGYWWCSDAKLDINIWSRALRGSNGAINRNDFKSSMGMSIRCLKNTTEASIPSVMTLDPESITVSSAVLNAQVLDDGGAFVTQRGFYISDTNPNPDETCQVETVNGEIGQYSIELIELDPNTNYYYKAFASNTKGTATGEAVVFKTNDNTVYTVPTVITNAASEIANNSAVLNAVISNNGGKTITQRGFYVSATNSNPDQTSQVITVEGETDHFSIELIGLEPNTSYYYKAFATNSIGTATGEAISFTTTNEINYSLPTVVAYAATNVSDDTATLNAQVTNNGGAEIQYQGFFYSSSSTDPNMNNGIIEIVQETSASFSQVLTELEPNTTYYYRSYAVNEVGMGMSSVLSFKTEPEIIVKTFVDSRDGHEYKMVDIGNQTWMGENLAWLPSVNSGSNGNLTYPYYYVMDYFGTNEEEAKYKFLYEKYGVLYNHAAAMTACPAGWHLPTDDEWKELELFVGVPIQEIDNVYDMKGVDLNIGHKLKSAEPNTWANNVGTDDFGFAAVGSGSRGFDTFGNYTGYGGWWTANYDFNNSFATMRELSSYYTGIYSTSKRTDMGYSVRCIKD